MSTVPSPNHASTSQNPNVAVPASYHPEPRPAPAPLPLMTERMDTHAIKQELHDALGEDGLPYWKALNGYLLGQIGRGELEGMVRSWFKGPKVSLHNKLLLSLLHNAGSTPQHQPPVSPLSQKKRKRVAYDDSEFDVDEVTIEPKSRVSQWVMGMGGRERARVRRVVLGKQMEKDGDGDADGEGDIEEGEKGKGKWSTFGASTLIPPLAVPSRSLPSSQQLSLRLSQFAKTHDLALSPDATGDIGEFMAVGMDAYLGDIFHGVVHLTGRNRPGGGTIRVPHGRGVNDNESVLTNGFKDDNIKSEKKQQAFDVGSMPKPDISTLHHLFTLNPALHPQASPALHRLATSHTQGEIEMTTPRPKSEIDVTGPVAASTMGMNRAESVSKNLLATGLLKLDKAGRQDVDGEKKERKHTLHWKYEDPALILRDVLG